MELQYSSTPIEPAALPSRPSPSSSRTLFIIICILFLTFFVTLFETYLINDKKSDNSSNAVTSVIKPTIIPTATPTPIISMVDTSKWQSYTDPDDTYSFHYPPDYIISEVINGINLSTDSINIKFRTDHDPLVEFYTLYRLPDGDKYQNPIYVRTKINNTEISGYKATIFTVKNTLGNGLDINAYIVEGQPLSLISAHLDTVPVEEYLPIFYKIIDSIQYIQ